MNAKIAVLATALSMFGARELAAQEQPVGTYGQRARQLMQSAGQRAQQVRKAVGARIAPKPTLEGTRTQLSESPYAALGVAEGASPEAVLGMEGRTLNRGLILKKWRGRVEAYSTNKMAGRSKQEQAQAREVWLLLDKSKQALYEQLRKS